MDEPGVQLLRIVRFVPAASVHTEIQQSSKLFRIGHPVRKLPLNGDGLKLPCYLLKDKRRVRADLRYSHNG